MKPLICQCRTIIGLAIAPLAESLCKTQVRPHFLVQIVAQELVDVVDVGAIQRIIDVRIQPVDSLAREVLEC